MQSPHTENQGQNPPAMEAQGDGATPVAPHAAKHALMQTEMVIMWDSLTKLTQSIKLWFQSYSNQQEGVED